MLMHHECWDASVAQGDNKLLSNPILTAALLVFHFLTDEMNELKANEVDAVIDGLVLARGKQNEPKADYKRKRW